MAGSRKDNLVPLAFLLSISFVVGLAQTYFSLSAYSLCLSEFGVRSVLYATAFASLLLPLAGQAYCWLSTRISFARVITLTFGLMSLSVIVHWLGLLVDNTGCSKLMLVLFAEFLSVFTGLVFWDLASRVFPDGKGSSVFAVVGAGFPVARAVGGATAAVFTQHFPTTHLLLGAVFALVVSAVLMVILARLRANSVTHGTQLSAAAAPSHEDLHASGKRKTALILIFAALSVFGCRYVNHIFDDVASSCFSAEAQLAQCLGRIEILMGITQLVFMTVVSGRFLKRRGPLAGLLVPPVALACGAATLLIGWSSAARLAPVFWIAASTKILAKVLRMSLENPALMMVYQTFAPVTRVRLMASVQAKVRPLASAAGGGSLILINTATGWGLGMKTALALGIAVFWCLTAVTLCGACRRSEGADARIGRGTTKGSAHFTVHLRAAGKPSRCWHLAPGTCTRKTGNAASQCVGRRRNRNGYVKGRVRGPP